MQNQATNWVVGFLLILIRLSFRLCFEVAVARYLRLVSTLIDEDVNGLGVGDSDQLTLLIGSLAEPAKSYVLHHSQGATELTVGRL